jgi:hypothetical protein
MTKVTIELELDEASYRREYGPGSEHWAKYMYNSSQGPNGEWVKTPKADSDYKPLEGQALNETIVEILREGFYDWQSDGRQWLKLTIDGKAMRHCCYTTDGDKHKDYCPVIAGPEATE